MKEAARFLKEAKGKVGILFDGDCDGICAAAILNTFFKRKDIQPKLFTGDLEAGTFETFAKQPLDFWIIADLPVAENPGWLDGLKGRKLLILDHHPPINDLNKFGFLYINPRLKDPKVYRCTSHLALDVVEAAGFKGMEWLSKLGQVGDHEIDGNDEEREAADIINAVVATKLEDSAVKLVSYLSKSSLKQLLTEKRYLKLRDEFVKELEKQIALYDVSAVGEVTFFEVKGRFSMASLVASKLFDLYPRRTIITYSRKRSEWGVSGRSRKYDMGEMFRKAAEGIGQAGGHPVAAGGRINNFDLFKQRLQKMLK